HVRESHGYPFFVSGNRSTRGIGRHRGKFPGGIHIRIRPLSPDELRQVPSVCTKYDLDFDNAYQYVAADANNLKLVSLDHDFDRIPAGRMHPKDI
ncbi:MAG: hypothetical protein WC362_01735, partial [Methanoregula sp.]